LTVEREEFSVIIVPIHIGDMVSEEHSRAVRIAVVCAFSRGSADRFGIAFSAGATTSVWPARFSITLGNACTSSDGGYAREPIFAFLNINPCSTGNASKDFKAFAFKCARNTESVVLFFQGILLADIG